MHMVFRDHTISDMIGFVYSGMDPGGCRCICCTTFKKQLGLCSRRDGTQSCR